MAVPQPGTTTLGTAPQETWDDIVRHNFPSDGHFDYDIADFADACNLRAVGIPQLARAVDENWRTFSRRNNYRIRLVATVNDMDFGPVARFLQRMGRENVTHIYRILIYLHSIPSLDQSLPNSFWSLLQQAYRNPSLNVRIHLRADYASRWRVSAWERYARRALALAQNPQRSEISTKTELHQRYSDWRQTAIDALIREEADL